MERSSNQNRDFDLDSILVRISISTSKVRIDNSTKGKKTYNGKSAILGVGVAISITN